MKKIQFALSTMLPVMALTAALCFASQPTLAQSAPDSSRNTTTQQQPMQPDNQNAANAANAASEKTFSGKIVKSGNKLVLTAADSKTTYQLDDQQKAQDFLNKSVKVTGVLDASAGTIRVSAIDPA
jgi:high-affinity Fe2+/Pb2+ permease